MKPQHATWKGLPRIFWLLVAGVFINRLGSFYYLFSYFLPEQHHFSEQMVGITITLFGIGAIVSGPLGGWLADHLGRRRSMIFSMVVGAGAMWQVGIASARWHVLVSIFLLGLCGELYRPAVNAAIADLVSPAERPRAYGWSYWAANLGFAGSALLGGLLVKISYFTLFTVDAATTLLFAGMVFFFIPETHASPESTSPEDSSLPKSSQGPYTDRVFLVFLAVQLLLEFLLYQSIVSLGLDVKKHGFSAQQFAYLNLVNAALIATIQPFLRRAIRYCRRSVVFASAAVLIGSGLGLFVVAVGSLGFAIVATMLWTLGEILMFSMVPTVIYDLSPQQARGRYQGAYQLIVSVATLAAPLYGAFLLSHYGSKTLWLSCLGVGLGAACLHLFIAPARKRRLIQLYGLAEATHREEGTKT